MKFLTIGLLGIPNYLMFAWEFGSGKVPTGLLILSGAYLGVVFLIGELFGEKKK